MHLHMLQIRSRKTLVSFPAHDGMGNEAKQSISAGAQNIQ